MRWILAVALCMVVATTARGEDWGVRRDPFDLGVVRRHKAILARDPHDARSLRALIAMYKRYRTVDKLEAEYRSQLGTGEDWATLVVLARMPQPTKAASRALWKRALTANPQDARGWLAAGDATTEPAAARDLYRRAASLTTEPRRKRAALHKLIGAAGLAGDARTVDHTYGELIALSPTDGGLWLDRGNAQLAAKQFAAARDSFAAAIPLLRTDPERRLAAMMNGGIALDRMGRADDAIAQFVRTLDQVPRGYYLDQELVLRIVEIERRRKRLPEVTAWLEARWPERRRGHFEWVTLGDLHAERRDDLGARGAYERAVARAPTEVATQRKLIALLDRVDPTAALAQHERAARVAPGEVDLQIALARRYHSLQPDRAYATLEALARRMRGSVGTRQKLAELYEEWAQPLRALPEYEAIAGLEPRDPDHAIVLGEAYWRADQPTKAQQAWARLDEIGTADALRRHGEQLALHDLMAPAAEAYTRALAVDGTSIDAWYGRARAYHARGKLPAAIEDARRAVALTADAQHAEGLRTRQLLVRELGHAHTAADRAPLERALVRWRFAFDRGDRTAGYLLAAHHARIRSHQLHDVLVALYRLAPDDDALGIALSRSFEKRGEFDRATRELEAIARRTPARAKDMARLIELVERDRESYERELRAEEEGERARSHSPDLVGRSHRVGMRLEVGADARAASGAVFGFGLYTTAGRTKATAYAVRLDWTKRNDAMEEVNTFALAGALAVRVLDARKFELAVSVGPRVELRYNRSSPTAWNRAAIAGDLTLELLPRAIPATVGLRFDQILTDRARSSALLLELGFEVR